MKIRLILLSCLISVAAFSQAQNNSLVGTWKLASGKMTTGDSTVSYGTQTGESIKIITPTHFSVMGKEVTDSVGQFAGGRVKMDKTTYTEYLDFTSRKGMENQMATFTYRIEGNKCYLKGGTGALKFDEVWERVQ
jgi:hypothetical protein